jgi:hypothetical protein
LHGSRPSFIPSCVATTSGSIARDSIAKDNAIQTNHRTAGKTIRSRGGACSAQSAVPIARHPLLRITYQGRKCTCGSDGLSPEPRRRPRGSDLRLPSTTFDLPRDYLHGAVWPEFHHRHRDAPPDQQEAGRTLKAEADGACCARSGDDASATTSVGTGR